MHDCTNVQIFERQFDTFVHSYTPPRLVRTFYGLLSEDFGGARGSIGGRSPLGGHSGDFAAHFADLGCPSAPLEWQKQKFHKFERNELYLQSPIQGSFRSRYGDLW